MRVLKTFHTPLACIATAACAVALWPSPEAEARGRGFGTGLAIGVIGGIIASEIAKEATKAPKQPKSSTGSKSGKTNAGAPGGTGKSNAAGPGGTPGGSAPVGGPGGTPGGGPGGTMGIYAGAFGVIAAKDVVKWAEEADKRRIENEKREMTARLESDRNVDDAISKFVQDLRQRHTKLWGNDVAHVARGDSINEVTEGVVRLLVEEAYKQARLDEFDPGLPESMWSRERLTVFILRQARFGIDSFYTGVGARGPNADSLRVVFLNAAREVYARALETAEVMGVSHSFDKFIGKIYRTSTGNDDGLPTLGSDGRYEKMMSGVIESVALKTSDPQAGAMLGLDRQFLFRFRARRTLYDCVSASYASLAKLDATIPTSVIEGDAGSRLGTGLQSGAEIVTVSSEVWRRVEAHVQETCRVAVQASVLKAATEGDLHPQSVRADSYVKSGELTPVPMSLK